ncbi:unnamed protein product, partial [marine sediment metagenome]
MKAQVGTVARLMAARLKDGRTVRARINEDLVQEATGDPDPSVRRAARAELARREEMEREEARVQEMRPTPEPVEF